MPQVKLSGMKVEALLDLQDRIDEMLRKHRAEIEQRLERINRAIFIVNEARVAREGRSTLKGRKVPPKYRSPSGETWAGRGELACCGYQGWKEDR
jgi:DNA-binding protein H-NS